MPAPESSQDLSQVPAHGAGAERWEKADPKPRRKSSSLQSVGHAGRRHRDFASLASLPLIPGCSQSFQAGGSHRGGNGNTGATFLCCPGVKGSSGIAATTDRLFPFPRKSLDGTQMDPQNSRLPRSKAEKRDSSEHNLCSLPRARIKALQGERFLGTSVPLQGSEVSLCTPQMRETSLVDQREALERETGLGTLLL